MKRIFLISLITIIVKSGICQIPVGKGDYLVGGSINVGINTNMNISGSGDVSTSSKSYSLSFNPGVGRFLTDKIALGISPGIYIYRQDTTYNSSEIGIFGFGRLYIQNIFLHGGIGAGHNKSNYGYGEEKNNLFYIDLGAGYAYFINDNVSLDIMLKLHSQAKQYTNSDNINGSGRLSLNFGFQVFL